RALPRYAAMGASSRLRMLQYLPALRKGGISVDVGPLLGDGYISRMYSGGIPAASIDKGYLLRLNRLLSARRYDVMWIEKELWPWIPAWLEKLSPPKRPALVVAYDDAVFHRYDLHPSWVARKILGRKIDAVMRGADCVTAG